MHFIHGLHSTLLPVVLLYNIGQCQQIIGMCGREGGVYVYSLHTIIDHIPLHASTHRNTIKHVCKDVHTYVRTQRYKHIYKHTLKQTCMIDTGPSWMYSRADFLFPDILGLSAISILFMGTQLIELYNNTNHYHYIT